MEFWDITDPIAFGSLMYRNGNLVLWDASLDSIPAKNLMLLLA